MLMLKYLAVSVVLAEKIPLECNSVDHSTPICTDMYTAIETGLDTMEKPMSWISLQNGNFTTNDKSTTFDLHGVIAPQVNCTEG